MLIVLERKCMDLSEANEQLSEKQELLTTLMESKKSLQKVALEEFQRKIFQELKELEEQKSKEVLELLGRKHKLVKLEKERDRARMLQEREPSGAEGDSNVATDSSSFCSCSPSLAHDVDEAMSTPSRKSPSMVKDRDWWSADLEGEVEKLEVEGSFSVTEGGFMDTERKADHWSARTVLTKEESEEVKGAEKEKQRMEVVEVITETQPSSNETNGGFTMCEVEEQQTARVEVQGPKTSNEVAEMVKKVLKKFNRGG